MFLNGAPRILQRGADIITGKETPREGSTAHQACQSGLATSDTVPLLDGIWKDELGIVGVIEDNIVLWAHPVDTDSTKLAIHGKELSLSLSFMDEPMEGIIADSGVRICWKTGDVWQKVDYGGWKPEIVRCFN